MFRAATVVGLAVLTPLSLAACADPSIGQAENLPVPVSVATSAVSIKPPATAPTKSIAAQNFPRTDGGAADFVTWWFAALNDAYRSGESAQVREASDPECTACQDFLGRHRAYVAGGGPTLQEPFSVRDLTAADADTGVALVAARYRAPSEASRWIHLAVRWTGNRWVMGEIGQ